MNTSLKCVCILYKTPKWHTCSRWMSPFLHLGTMFSVVCYNKHVSLLKIFMLMFFPFWQVLIFISLLSAFVAVVCRIFNLNYLNILKKFMLQQCSGPMFIYLFIFDRRPFCFNAYQRFVFTCLLISGFGFCSLSHLQNLRSHLCFYPSTLGKVRYFQKMNLLISWFQLLETLHIFIFFHFYYPLYDIKV